MRSLVLPTHRGVPVTVDHCTDCRLVWFDALESVQLDGLGWVRLLRELGQGAGLPLADAKVARPACPVCAEPLTAVQNRTRFGLFAALECPRRHGHLHSHSGLLAERGMVRPLGAPERLALAKEGRALHCLNCGAAASPMDQNCSYCSTALVVIDLPRLAHSLRLRLEGMGPSPQARGRHVAWSCRGCGATLDPGREAGCTHCGHLVVVQDLPDVDPLLVAAEAELGAAAAAEAQRLSRFASSRQARPSAAGLAAIETRRRPPQAAIGWRRLMAGGWLPLWMVGIAAGAAAVVAWSGWSPVASSPLQALRAERVSAVPGRSWIWLEAYRQLQPGSTTGLDDLRHGLFDLQLRQMLGQPPLPDGTVGSVIDTAAGQRRGIRRPDAALRWDAALTGMLRAVRVDTEPPEVEASAGQRDRLVPSAPGVWIAAESRRRAVWAVAVENTGPVTVLASDLKAQMKISFRESVDWRCRPQAPGDGALPPGAKLALVCESTGQGNPVTWLTAMATLQGGRLPELFWSDQAARTAPGFAALTDRQTADAIAGSGRLNAFIQTHAKGLMSPLAPASAQAAARVDPKLEAAPVLSLQEQWQRQTGAQRQWLLFTGLLCAGVLFCALARALGERRAVYVSMLAAVALSYVFGRGQGAGSVLLVGMFLGLAALAVFAFTFAFRLYRQYVAEPS